MNEAQRQAIQAYREAVSAMATAEAELLAAGQTCEELKGKRVAASLALAPATEKYRAHVHNGVNGTELDGAAADYRDRRMAKATATAAYEAAHQEWVAARNRHEGATEEAAYLRDVMDAAVVGEPKPDRPSPPPQPKPERWPDDYERDDEAAAALVDIRDMLRSALATGGRRE